MSHRSWLLLIALGIAPLSEAKAQDAVPPPADGPAVQQGGDEGADDGGEGPRGFSIPVRIIDDPIEAESSEERAEEAARRERRDLAAQESMAESTQQIVVISWWQVGLASAGTLTAVVGTLFLVYNLVLARRATEAAVVAANAARDANVIIRLEQRPWLTIEQYELVPPSTVMSGTGHVTVSFTVKNVGKSPANILSTHVQTSIPETTSDTVAELRRLPIGNGRQYVMPGARTQISTFTPVEHFAYVSDPDLVSNMGRTDVFTFPVVVVINYQQAGGFGSFGTQSTFFLVKKTVPGGISWATMTGKQDDGHQNPFEFFW